MDREKEILLFVYERGEVRDKDFIEYFVNTPLGDPKHMARGTFYSHKKKLYAEEKIQKDINKKGNVIYFVPEKHRKEIENELLKQKAKNLVDRLPREKVEEIIRAYAVFGEIYNLYNSYVQKYGELQMMDWNPYQSSSGSKPKIIELYDRMVSIAKKQGIELTTVPLIQRVKYWIKWFEEVHNEMLETDAADMAYHARKDSR